MVNRIWRITFSDARHCSDRRTTSAGLARSQRTLNCWTTSPPTSLWTTELFDQGNDPCACWRLSKRIPACRVFQASNEAKESRSAKIDCSRTCAVRRLEAEADSRLAARRWRGAWIAKMFGGPVPVCYARSEGQAKGDKSKGPLYVDRRRSVYLEIRRNLTNPFLRGVRLS